MKKKSELPVISIENLDISFPSGEGENRVVSGVNFEVKRGEALGIVGESGSGKSLTSLAIMGLLPANARFTGRISYGGKGSEIDIGNLSEEEMRRVRGAEIAMIFQEPMTSLNPVHTCGRQVAESLLEHRKAGKKNVREKVIQLFKDVELPRPEHIYDAYPHQISGGQKQRVMIAMALSCDPKLIIADEPTTALDVTVQKKILEILRDLCTQRGMALIFITHDLGVVSKIADEIMVLYGGKVLETKPASDLLKDPETPYTKALIACRPRLDFSPVRLPVVSDFTSGKTKNTGEVLAKEESPKRDKRLLKVENLLVRFPLQKNWRGVPTGFLNAVDGVSFDVFKGETIGLVGESGCGKTTLGRTILKLIPSTSGTLNYDGTDITKMDSRDFRPFRKRMQLIFQDPYASLNPRYTVEQTIMEPMKVHGIGTDSRERKEKLANLLDRVGLPASAAFKYPHEFSGGQRQRICIARALAVNPEFIVCDESVSALDVSVQAMVLNLLNDLKDDFGLTYMFISHDLSVVKYMSDRLIVMNQGKIEEMGVSEDIYRNPESKYTKELISAIPQF
ncbi:MAG: ABC transporter ATP-binding protein [Cryomorphaceae bacterium]|nr:ABC transporter ATP-binding protein [Flavobacteriales bacterium]